MQDQLSPLGEILARLIRQGVVVPAPIPAQNAFPTARVVVPVYDSNGTSAPLPGTNQAQNNDAQLARRT
jgi:hypothetical protein